jgi:sulfate adenylyltransferase subunit 2
MDVSTSSSLPPHPKRLEKNSIYITREVIAEMCSPVMPYSIGKRLECYDAAFGRAREEPGQRAHFFSHRRAAQAWDPCNQRAELWRLDSALVERFGALIMVGDDRLPPDPCETPRMMRVRFRPLRFYPPTGDVECEAATADDIIVETRAATASERQRRLIDTDETGSMAKKKREGYF